MNFKFEEVVYSETANRHGIDNSLPTYRMDNLMRSTVEMQKVRDLLGVPCRVNSWYRCLKLNRLLESSDNSAHVKCLAIDFVPIGADIYECYNQIVQSDIVFDQLIIEESSTSTWLHISFDPQNRRQCLKIQVE